MLLFITGEVACGSTGGLEGVGADRCRWDGVAVNGGPAEAHGHDRVAAVTGWQPRQAPFSALPPIQPHLILKEIQPHSSWLPEFLL